KDEQIRSRADFLASETVWIYAWAGFSSAENRAEFDSFLNSYVATQHQLGRFPLFQDYHLQSPEDWLKIYEVRSEEHTSELQSRENLVCRLLLEKKKK